jgi:hypothetical protein
VALLSAKAYTIQSTAQQFRRDPMVIVTVSSPSLFRRGVALGLMLTLTACYTQRPLGTIPAPATRIVATMTEAGAVAMTKAIGPGSTEVEGVVVSVDADSWTLEMLRVDHRGRNSVTWNREHIIFPRDALANVAERALDKKRSWLAVGAIAASAVLIGGLLSSITSGGDESEPSAPTENVAPAGGRTY